MNRRLLAAFIACIAASAAARADQGSIQLVAGGALVATTNPLPVTIPVGSPGAVNLIQVGSNTVLTGGANGLLAVGGPVASGSVNADNPLKMGCAYNLTQPTVTDGKIVDLQCSAHGAKIVATGTDPFIVQQGAAIALSGAWPIKLTDGTNTAPTMDVAARAAFHKITDGTNTAAVKAASTAAVATDPSAVVALSPNSPIPAGSAIIGKAGIDQTTDGTTNAVHLVAGTALAGKFGIDQTTPGSTNGVQVNAALPTGANTIGKTNLLGNAGATLDAPLAAGTAPTNGMGLLGQFNSALPSLTNGQTASLQVTSAGVLSVDLTRSSSLSFGDAISGPSTAYPVIAEQTLYNGSTTDRERANFDTAALITLSAAGAGTTNSADQTNYNSRGANCAFNQSAHTGTPSTTFSIQVKDIASGLYVTMLTSAAITADATPTMLTVSAGTPNTANVSDGRPLSRTWRVSATVGGTTPAVTATIGCSVIR